LKSIFEDDFVTGSLTEEQEENLEKQVDALEGDNQETESPEGSEETGHVEETPETEHPSSKMYANKYKTIGALARGLTEIKSQLGEPSNLDDLDSPEDMEKEYLDAFRRFSSRKAPVKTDPGDDKYTVLQQQLEQTQSLVNQIVPLLVQRVQEPEKKEPQLSNEQQEFIKTMEEIYPGFTGYMEQLVMQRVKPQLEPLQQIASEFTDRMRLVEGWKAVADRNPDFQQYVPEMKNMTQQLAQENPGLFNLLQQDPKALYEYVYQRAKASKAGAIQQQVESEVSTILQKNNEEQAQIEAQKKAASMPSVGVKTTPKQKTIEEIVTEEILSLEKGGGIFDGLI